MLSSILLVILIELDVLTLNNLSLFILPILVILLYHDIYRSTQSFLKAIQKYNTLFSIVIITPSL